MALTVFSKQRGSVSLFLDPAVPAVASLQLENWGGAQVTKSIITRIAISSSCNFQVLHTLGGDAFLYVFGDRVGQIIVSGLAFDSVCGDPAGFIGIERVANYYNANRLVNRKLPIRMTLGAAMTFRMYLGGAQVDVEDVAARIWRFSFVLLDIPQPIKKLSPKPKSGSPDSGDGAAGEEGQPERILPIEPPVIDGRTPADSGGFVPLAEPVPAAAGSGYSDYGTGPEVTVRGFSL